MQNMADQCGNILRSFPERWHVQGDRIDAIQQVIAKPALEDQFLQVPVCRADDADIGPMRPRALPTGRYSFRSRKRSRLTCMGPGISPTSSRNSDPPSAAAMRPGFAVVAPVKAPFS